MTEEEAKLTRKRTPRPTTDEYIKPLMLKLGGKWTSYTPNALVRHFLAGQDELEYIDKALASLWSHMHPSEPVPAQTAIVEALKQKLFMTPSTVITSAIMFYGGKNSSKTRRKNA